MLERKSMKWFKIYLPVLIVLFSASQYRLLGKGRNNSASEPHYAIKKDATQVTSGGHPGVDTSPQCSSILNFIYSGKTAGNLRPPNDQESLVHQMTESLFRGNSGYGESATATIPSWLPTINDLWQHSIHPRLLPYILAWARSRLGKHRMRYVNKTLMDSDYRKVHAEFIVPNLRKSAIHPMEPNHMHNLLRIIERRLANPKRNPPLEIITFGPSVVQGFKSNYNKWWRPEYDRNTKGTYRAFAWPSGLEDLLNNVIFRGQNVVRVTNLASGGTSSTSGALAMEYRLFANMVPAPDIVIHSYGATDTRLSGRDDDSLRIIQEFVLAARKVRCDPDGLPYVILYDDFLGLTEDRNEFHMDFAMKNIRAVSQAADWYDVMAASYATAFRHTVYSGKGFGGIMTDQNNVSKNELLNLPMLGWALDVHPGMLYHSTAPWVLAFNLLDNMINACQDYSTILHYKPAYPKLSPSHIPPATRDILLRNLPKLWKENIAKYNTMCQHARTHVGSLCSRVSWMMNGSSGKKGLGPQDIEAYLAAMSMSSLQNWSAEDGKQHRIGWVATAPNATFTITVKDSQHDGIKSMSIVTMKSYSILWEGSRLQVTVWDEGYKGRGPQSIVGQYEVEGFHKSTTSVFFDHKFYLGEKGIPKGNWLKARFDLIGGNTFKIQGILFCSF